MKIEDYRPKVPGSDISQACFNCRFWLAEDTTEEEAGACRFLPPKVVSPEKAVEPRTNGSRWCGQWEGRADG